MNPLGLLAMLGGGDNVPTPSSPADSMSTGFDTWLDDMLGGTVQSPTGDNDSARGLGDGAGSSSDGSAAGLLFAAGAVPSTFAAPAATQAAASSSTTHTPGSGGGFPTPPRAPAAPVPEPGVGAADQAVSTTPGPSGAEPSDAAATPRSMARPMPASGVRSPAGMAGAMPTSNAPQAADSAVPAGDPVASEPTGWQGTQTSSVSPVVEAASRPQGGGAQSSVSEGVDASGERDTGARDGDGGSDTSDGDAEYRASQGTGQRQLGAPGTAVAPTDSFTAVATQVAAASPSDGDGAPVEATKTGEPLPQARPTAAPTLLPPAPGTPDGVVRVVVDADLTVEIALDGAVESLATTESVDVVLDGTRQALEPLRDLGPELHDALRSGGFYLGNFSSHERQADDRYRGQTSKPAEEPTLQYVARGELVNAVA